MDDKIKEALKTLREAGAEVIEYPEAVEVKTFKDTWGRREINKGDTVAVIRGEK